MSRGRPSMYLHINQAEYLYVVYTYHGVTLQLRILYIASFNNNF